MTSDPARGPRLRLVCVNDVYTLENLPRLATLVRSFAETDRADVLVTTLAGDFLAPSLLSSLDAGRGMVDCMNAIPITHVTFGNHEDDVPLAELRKRVTELAGTWLATNVPRFSPALPRSQVLEVAAPGGARVRVGLVGVVTRDPSLYRDVPFGSSGLDPANESALREAARLRTDERCDVVIPLTHQPIEDDRALAASALPLPFPVIVGGHEHDLFVERVAGSMIVKAGADAVRAIVVDLAWSPSRADAGAPAVSVRVVEVAGFAEDAPLRVRVDAHMAAVRALSGATLLTIPVGETLSSIGARARQTTLGALFCSLLRDAFEADAALLNGGGLRGAREYRRALTYADLEAEVPFENEIVVARLPGRVLAEAVEASRAHAPSESGGFLQVDDRMSFERERLVTVDGAPLDVAREYRVALVRNLFGGLDHIAPLIAFAAAEPTRIPPPESGCDVKEALVRALSRKLFHDLGPFDAIDTDHDGSVEARELADAVARVTAEPASSVTVELLMKAVDTNHDRRISREEADATNPRPSPSARAKLPK